MNPRRRRIARGRRAIRRAAALRPRRAVIRWRNKFTGETGCTGPMPAKAARQTVESANRVFPNLDHWTEALTEAVDAERS